MIDELQDRNSSPVWKARKILLQRIIHVDVPIVDHSQDDCQGHPLRDRGDTIPALIAVGNGVLDVRKPKRLLKENLVALSDKNGSRQ